MSQSRTMTPLAEGPATSFPADSTAARRPAGIVRRWRWPAGLALAVIAAGVVIALLQPSAAGYLDPNGTGPTGGHALADLAAARGQQVIRTSAPPSASTTSTSSRTASDEAGLELIASPDLLTTAQLAQAARFPGDILLIDPGPAALRALAPAVRLIGQEPDATGAGPLCDSEAASLAGDADIGGDVLQTSDPAADTCYPGGGGYSLIRYRDGARTVAVLGSGAPLTNQYLADQGDAALALNLLGPVRKVLWVVPSPSAAPGAPAGSGGGQRSFFSLVPWPAYLIAIQLGVAALLAAAWRARRLGPLTSERLPVIVRASETVEGHGRLYHARRARDRAAEELRAATRARIARLTGTSATGTSATGTNATGISASASTNATAVAETAAARTGQPPDAVRRLLYGQPPATDAELVTLAADLDTLERKVRQS
jgi:hypothetical protein